MTCDYLPIIAHLSVMPSALLLYRHLWLASFLFCDPCVPSSASCCLMCLLVGRNYSLDCNFLNCNKLICGKKWFLIIYVFLSEDQVRLSLSSLLLIMVLGVHFGMGLLSFCLFSYLIYIYVFWYLRVLFWGWVCDLLSLSCGFSDFFSKYILIPLQILVVLMGPFDLSYAN